MPAAWIEKSSRACQKGRGSTAVFRLGDRGPRGHEQATWSSWIPWQSVTLDTRVCMNVFLGKDTDPLSDFQRFSKKLKNHRKTFD